MLSKIIRTNSREIRRQIRKPQAVAATAAGNLGTSRGCAATSINFFFSSAAASSPPHGEETSLVSQIERLPPFFLRKSDPMYIDPLTHQRTDVKCDLIDGRPVSSEVLSNSSYEIQHVKLGHDGTTVMIQWKDGHTSNFTFEWIRTQLSRLTLSSTTQNQDSVPRLPWTNLTEEKVRSTTKQGSLYSISFDDLVDESNNSTDGNLNNNQTVKEAVRILHQYGILLVTSTPVDDKGAGIAALASAISGPAYKPPDTTLFGHYQMIMSHKADAATGTSPPPPKSLLEHGTDGPSKTMYGNIWSTASADMADGASTADTAYGTGALSLHNDMGYYKNPPGLQIFTMCNPAIKKQDSTQEEGGAGESIFGDGLAVAEYMRIHHPKEFDTLCRTPRRYRSIDLEMGWYLEACGPIIKAVDNFAGVHLDHTTTTRPSNNNANRWGEVLQIRHNDLDRLPDLPPRILVESGDEEAIEKFYQDLEQAHKVWDELLGRDEFRLVVKMKRGDTMVVANQRCFHGRYGFSSSPSNPRSVMGCYVSQDDLDSRVRWMMDGNCTLD